MDDIIRIIAYITVLAVPCGIGLLALYAAFGTAGLALLGITAAIGGVFLFCYLVNGACCN